MKKNNAFFERLLRLVPVGKENAVPQSYLASLLGVETSAVRSYVLMARSLGYFILGDQNGYYKPRTLAEMHDYYVYRHNYAMTTLRSLKRLRDTLRQYGVISPEKSLPAFLDGEELVPDSNPIPESEKKNMKPYQTCFVFFWKGDEEEELLEDLEELEEEEE